MTAKKKPIVKSKIAKPKKVTGRRGPETRVQPQPNFPIVGIGASADGLEALEIFLANVPVDSGMAFVIVQHLDPNYKEGCTSGSK